jgi:hypothetical protein
VIKYIQNGEQRMRYQVIAVAGTYAGEDVDPKTSLIKGAADGEVAGVRVELHGKEYLNQRQSAIFDLTCDTTAEVSLGGRGSVTVDWNPEV